MMQVRARRASFSKPAHGSRALAARNFPDGLFCFLLARKSTARRSRHGRRVVGGDTGRGLQSADAASRSAPLNAHSGPWWPDVNGKASVDLNDARRRINSFSVEVYNGGACTRRSGIHRPSKWKPPSHKTMRGHASRRPRCHGDYRVSLRGAAQHCHPNSEIQAVNGCNAASKALQTSGGPSALIKQRSLDAARQSSP